MKLGYITHKVHRSGGMERASAEVLERLAQKHPVVVLARECAVQSAQLTFVPVHPLPRPNALLAWSFGLKARQWEKRLEFSVTHSVGASAIDADVITAQFCHRGFHRQLGGLRGGDSRLRRFYQNRAEQFFVRQERRAYTSPRLQIVIAVSEGIKRELTAYYGVAPDKIRVIPNAVDHGVFQPAGSETAKRALRLALGLPEDEFICLFVGGDWERKGLADAVRAVAGLPRTTLVVVGPGDSAPFQALARGLDAERQVIFAGKSLRPQEFYAAADTFVFPSRYEAFSLVTLEAAAAGLPLIARRINGTEELIQDGENGFFVEDAAEGLRDKIDCLRQDRARRGRMAAAARESARRYTWERVAAEQMEALEAAACR